MNVLTIPYITGGLSHLIPLYVLQQKYIRCNNGVKNYFLVNSNSQRYLMRQAVQCVPINYVLDQSIITGNNNLSIYNAVVEMEMRAYDIVKPSFLVEDTACSTPLIAEKNHVPRISIQRTGMFRAIDKRYRNANHRHSLQSGSVSNEFKVHNIGKCSNSDLYYLQQYPRPKAKIIPGIATIERLPENIEDTESYFYSGPLTVLDMPTKSLSDRLDEFLDNNRKKPIVFISTGTIDRTPTEEFIEFFVKRNYAVITTCNCEMNEAYKQNIFYNKLLPLHHICEISDLVIHQCGSGIYHYPIMNGVPCLTIGTQCYDREDIALRLQELGISGHIPHPDDNPNYWNIFLEMVNRFENNTLTNHDVMEKLQNEINDTMSNFEMGKVIKYTLT